MKALILLTVVILSVSPAMAEEPCRSPIDAACQKACSVMGAKYILLMREKSFTTPVRAQVDSWQSIEDAHRLADFAGLPLSFIDRLTVQQINRAIAAFCPQ